MSRSGYSDDFGDDDPWAMIRYRGAVTSALRGARGQRMLRELAAALDAMPDKRLIAHELVAEGEHCALGVLAVHRGISDVLPALDPEDPQRVAQAFDIAEALAREIVYENDEGVDGFEWVDIVGPPHPFRNRYGHPQIHVPTRRLEERRWRHVRAWVERHLKKEPASAANV